MVIFTITVSQIWQYSKTRKNVNGFSVKTIMKLSVF